MSKQRCQALAKRVGAVITEPDYIRLEAPSGKTFDGEVHEQIYYYSEGNKGDAWIDVLLDLKYMDRIGGFPTCQKKLDSEVCEWCDQVEEMVGA